VLLINEKLTFWKRFTIREWITLSRSPICCIPSNRNEVVKINFVRFLPSKGCSMSNHSTTSLFLMIVLISHRRIWQNKVHLRVIFCLIGHIREDHFHG